MVRVGQCQGSQHSIGDDRVDSRAEARMERQAGPKIWEMCDSGKWNGAAVKVVRASITTAAAPSRGGDSCNLAARLQGRCHA